MSVGTVNGGKNPSLLLESTTSAGKVAKGPPGRNWLKEHQCVLIGTSDLASHTSEPSACLYGDRHHQSCHGPNPRSGLYIHPHSLTKVSIVGQNPTQSPLKFRACPGQDLAKIRGLENRTISRRLRNSSEQVTSNCDLIQSDNNNHFILRILFKSSTF